MMVLTSSISLLAKAWPMPELQPVMTAVGIFDVSVFVHSIIHATAVVVRKKL